MDKNQIDFSLYLVTDRRLIGSRDLYACVEEAIDGGVTLVQLREKDASAREFYELACRLRELTRRKGVPLLINDRLDIAQAVDADGLHIGQSDLPAAVARRLLGPNKLIGVSAATLQEAQTAERDGADYLGTGAVFTTTTKADPTAVSRELLQDIVSAVDIPVVAIGGITADNASKLTKTGIAGLSVVSAILGAADIRQAAGRLRQLMA